MSDSYPKHPREIQVRIIQRDMEDGLVSGIATTAEVALSDKLKDYLLRLGYSSAHISGLIVQLMTKEKVRIDFRDYSERIELVDPEDKLSSAQAMTLLDDFVTETRGGEVEDPDQKKTTTQKIIVQFPKSPRG